jgi:hypothetical protein
MTPCEEALLKNVEKAGGVITDGIANLADRSGVSKRHAQRCINVGNLKEILIKTLTPGRCARIVIKQRKDKHNDHYTKHESATGILETVQVANEVKGKAKPD